MAGGKREGAGRKKGIPNKATAEIKDIARQYVPDAVRELARLSQHAESEQARVSAIKEILDRAYGKAPQSLTGPNDGPLSIIARIERVIVDPADSDAAGVSSAAGGEEV